MSSVGNKDLLKEIFYFLSIQESEELAKSNYAFEQLSKAVFNDVNYWIQRYESTLKVEPNYLSKTYLRKILIVAETTNRLYEYAKVFSHYPSTPEIDEDLLNIANLTKEPIKNLITTEGIVHIGVIISILKLEAIKFGSKPLFTSFDESEELYLPKYVNLMSNMKDDNQFKEFCDCFQNNNEVKANLLKYALFISNPSVTEVFIGNAFEIDDILTEFLAIATPELFEAKKNIIWRNGKINLNHPFSSELGTNEKLLFYLNQKYPTKIKPIYPQLNYSHASTFFQLHKKLKDSPYIEQDTKAILLSVLDYKNKDEVEEFLNLNEYDSTIEEEKTIYEKLKEDERDFLVKYSKRVRKLFHPNFFFRYLTSAAKKNDWELYESIVNPSTVFSAVSYNRKYLTLEQMKKMLKYADGSHYTKSNNITSNLLDTEPDKLKLLLDQKGVSSFIDYKKLGSADIKMLDNMITILESIEGTTRLDYFVLLKSLYKSLYKKLKKYHSENDEVTKYVDAILSVLKFKFDKRYSTDIGINLLDLAEESGIKKLITATKNYL